LAKEEELIAGDMSIDTAALQKGWDEWGARQLAEHGDPCLEYKIRCSPCAFEDTKVDENKSVGVRVVRQKKMRGQNQASLFSGGKNPDPIPKYEIYFSETNGSLNEGDLITECSEFILRAAGQSPVNKPQKFGTLKHDYLFLWNADLPPAPVEEPAATAPATS
jgi:hypothetical protein